MVTVRDVTLSEILAAREKRAARRRELMDCGNVALAQLTVNIPGNRKTSRMIRQIFLEGVSAIARVAGMNKQLVLPDLLTGPEGYFLFSKTAVELKMSTLELEESHPLGRFWDIDIFFRPGRSLSRKELGFSGRRCYLCSRPAHECARSRAHSDGEIMAIITARMEGYNYAVENNCTKLEK